MLGCFPIDLAYLVARCLHFGRPAPYRSMTTPSPFGHLNSLPLGSADALGHHTHAMPGISPTLQAQDILVVATQREVIPNVNQSSYRRGVYCHPR